ncbi:ATP-binding cassette domain-containing protein [Sulfitobacter sp.]|uniref:ATP-binding cassette domain-containing protein n=1 Tax=Sulfitobacter sp. TaxID=1903071 RepID=UPI003F6C9563
MNGRFADLVKAVVVYSPRKSISLFGLYLLAAALEGAGIALFIPFFAVMIGGQTAASRSPSVLDHWLGAGQTSQWILVLFCVIFVVTIIMRAIVSKHRDEAAFKLSTYFSDQLRVDLLGNLAQVRWSFMAGLKQAYVENMLISEIVRVKSAVTLMGVALVDVTLLVCYGTILVYLSPVLAVAIILAVGVLFLWLRPIMRKAQDLGRGVTQTGQALHTITSEFLQNLKTAKAQQLEARYLFFFEKAVKASQHKSLDFKQRQLSNGVFLQGVMAGLIALLLLTGTFLIQTPPEFLLLIILLLARLTPILQRLNQNVQSIENLLPAYDALRAFSRDCAAAQNHALPAIPFENPQGWADDPGCLLRFKGVSFAFDPEAPLLCDADLDVKIGEFIAITGPSGAGKTTLIDLALGLYQPQSGQINHFETTATPAVGRGYLNQISYIPQQTFLANMTIRENLLWVQGDATDAEIDNALQLSGAADFIGALPQGLETVVGDRGNRLSGGERQRISLAQALLRRPRLVICDEGLNAISQDDLGPLLASLRKADPNMAFIYVTHRLFDTHLMDRVFHVSGASLTEIHPHEARLAEV